MYNIDRLANKSRNPMNNRTYFRLLNNLDEVIDKTYNKLTPMESACLVLSCYGMTRNEIAEHFELSRTHVAHIFTEMKKKLLATAETAKLDCDL